MTDCIDMLHMASVVYCVKHASGNGPPLESESDRKSFKPLFLDVGLMTKPLGDQSSRRIAAALQQGDRRAIALQVLNR